MEWIHYTLANRCRFDVNARMALDALTEEFGFVGVRPPIVTDGSTWEIEVSAGDDPFSYWVSGRTLAEAARNLANWKGIDLRGRQN